MSSILNQIRWAKNPFAGLPEAYARGQSLKLQKEQFEESKKRAKLHQKTVMDQEARAQEKHQAVMAQQDQARKVRTYKHWDKALGEVEGAMQQDPSGSMANTIMQGYRQIAEENPQHFDPELTQQTANVKIAPVGWQAPRGVEQAEGIFTPEQIPQFRQQLQQGIQSLGVATSPEQQQERQLGQAKLSQVGLTMEKGAAQLTKTQLENVKTLKEEERKRTLGSDMLMLQSIQRLKKVATEQPELYGQAFQQEMQRIQPQLQKLDPQSAQMMADPNFSIAPDQLQQMEQAMKERYATSSDPKQYRDWMLKTADRVFQQTQDPADQNPDVARMKPELWEQAKQQALQESMMARKAGATTVYNIPPTARTLGSAQEGVKAAATLRYSLDQIESLFGDDDLSNFFGYSARAKAKIGTFVDNIGLLPEQYRTGFNKLLRVRKAVKDINLEEVHRFFGGALTFSEIKRSRDAILDVNMSPEQVRATLEEMRETSNRLEAINSTMMNVDFEKGSKEWRREFDKRYVGVLSEDLQKRGLDEKQIKADLHRRGLLKLYKQMQSPVTGAGTAVTEAAAAAKRPKPQNVRDALSTFLEMKRRVEAEGGDPKTDEDVLEAYRAYKSMGK